MSSQLQQALRILCSNTDWNYAVFWKLQHRDHRMMLTWKDAYYHNHVGNLCDARYSHDSLRIVGPVAVTGKHLWISSADKNVTGSCSSFEYCDGWETQLSSGIRTIAVVAVVPHGVVQLGSLNKIAEDLKQVKRIRDIFVELQVHTDWEKEKTETVNEMAVQGTTSSDLLMRKPSSENLLVANVCHSGTDISICEFSEQSDRTKESAKINKKRDRQLIQDRIKELRNLVPNGSKCSIDSLLEQTVKHTLFMKYITEHADNLGTDNCERRNRSL